MIRPMILADVSVCLELWRRSEALVLRIAADNEAVVARFLDRNAGLSFVAESEGRVIGNILCDHDGYCGYLHQLTACPRHRQEGVAAAMLAASIKALRERGIHRCHAFVAFRNLNALNFWRSAGCDVRSDLRSVSVGAGRSLPMARRIEGRGTPLMDAKGRI